MKIVEFDIKKLKKITRENCFICQNKINTENIVFENKNFIAFLDYYPSTLGYTLLAPKKHYEDISEFSKKEFDEMKNILFRIVKSIKKNLKPDRIYLLNTGEIVTHFHIHIIPIYYETHTNFVDVLLRKKLLKLTKMERKKLSLKIKKSI